MKSILSVFKEGNGPSSSHTVGPFSAAKLFKKRYDNMDAYKVILYGSLAMTGGGHGTDKAIKTAIPNAEIIHDENEKNIPHPNTMDFEAIKNGKVVASMRVMSVGGGSIKVEDEDDFEPEDVYKEKNFEDFLNICKNKKITIPEYVYSIEGDKIKQVLLKRWGSMQKIIEKGLKEEGELPGGLHVTRKAKMLNSTPSHNESSSVTRDRLIASYAYACLEENADGNIIVTAPTCGSCGVVPAVLYYLKKQKGFTDEEIVNALVVAGVIGNVIRTNASISGAECGCQAEIGSACSMAAGAIAHIYGLSLDQIEYAAEVAMEHHLGLTCDPVKGLVQIPCIERNAVAAMRAFNSVNLSRFLYSTRKISFDTVIETMYRTGLDLNQKYKETAHGGLAALYKNK